MKYRKRKLKRWVNRARKYIVCTMGALSFLYVFGVNGLPGYSTYASGSADVSSNELQAISIQKKIAFQASENTSRLPVFAHRGYSSRALEGTYEAYDKAIQAGVAQVEIDLYRSKDGVFYICHDESTGRIAKSNLTIPRTDSDKLDQIILNNGEHLHRLEDVMNKYQDSLIYLIELKNGKDADAFASFMEEHDDLLHNVFVQAWDVDALETIDKILPGMEKWFLTSSASSISKALESDAVNGLSIEAKLVSPALVQTIHETGREVWVWTLDDAGSISKYKAMGVDGIVSNNPDTALTVLYPDAVRYCDQDCRNGSRNQN